MDTYSRSSLTEPTLPNSLPYLFVVVVIVALSNCCFSGFISLCRQAGFELMTLLLQLGPLTSVTLLTGASLSR